MYDCEVPVIAAVHGFCLGGGIGLAGNADIVVASDDATFGLPEVDRGALGVATHLARFVPQHKLRAMFLTGAMITAAELLAFGTVERVVPRAELLDDRARARGGDRGEEPDRDAPGEGVAQHDRSGRREALLPRSSRASRSSSTSGATATSSARRSSTSATPTSLTVATPESTAHDSKDDVGPFRAVIFDLGGVVFASPFEAFDAYDRGARTPDPERARADPQQQRDGAWAALERGELTMDAFAIALEAEARRRGLRARRARVMR